jgi:hypothetical protein
MATLKYSANSSFQAGTLGSSYTSGGVSLALTAGHGSRFPSTGDFWVRVEDEIFKCTARSTDTLTVVGAQDGTAAANHASASAVTWVLAVAAFDQVRTDLGSMYDTYANIAAATPGANEVGKMAFSTNSLYSARWNGSAWQWFYNNSPVTLPPTAGWTWDNQGTATETQAGGYLYLNAPAVSGGNSRVRYRTAPAAPWTLTALVNANVNHLSNQQVGILVRGSGSGKLYLFGPGASAAASQTTQVVKNNNPTSWSGTPSSLNGPLPTAPMWLQITDNNTDLLFSYSRDGINFSQVYQDTRASFLTPDQIGYFAETQSTSLLASLTLLSWVLT